MFVTFSPPFIFVTWPTFRQANRRRNSRRPTYVDAASDNAINSASGDIAAANAAANATATAANTQSDTVESVDMQEITKEATLRESQWPYSDCSPGSLPVTPLRKFDHPRT